MIKRRNLEKQYKILILSNTQSSLCHYLEYTITILNKKCRTTHIHPFLAIDSHYQE